MCCVTETSKNGVNNKTGKTTVSFEMCVLNRCFQFRVENDLKRTSRHNSFAAAWTRRGRARLKRHPVHTRTRASARGRVNVGRRRRPTGRRGGRQTTKKTRCYPRLGRGRPAYTRTRRARGLSHTRRVRDGHASRCACGETPAPAADVLHAVRVHSKSRGSTTTAGTVAAAAAVFAPCPDANGKWRWRQTTTTRTTPARYCRILTKSTGAVLLFITRRRGENDLGRADPCAYNTTRTDVFRTRVRGSRFGRVSRGSRFHRGGRGTRDEVRDDNARFQYCFFFRCRYGLWWYLQTREKKQNEFTVCFTE